MGSGGSNDSFHGSNRLTVAEEMAVWAKDIDRRPAKKIKKEGTLANSNFRGFFHFFGSDNTSVARPSMFEGTLLEMARSRARCAFGLDDEILVVIWGLCHIGNA